MSVDQNILYRACRAVITGHCPADLAQRTLGPVFHARWLTLAIRVVFLYMSIAQPSEHLFRLTWFVVNIYCYLWFKAKCQWRATEAPLIAFDAMKLIDSLPDHEKLVLCPVFERGFMYWAHPEQLFLGCLASSDDDMRARAVARIIRLRHPAEAAVEKANPKKRKTKSVVRIFELPYIW